MPNPDGTLYRPSAEEMERHRKQQAKREAKGRKKKNKYIEKFRKFFSSYGLSEKYLKEEGFRFCPFFNAINTAIGGIYVDAIVENTRVALLEEEGKSKKAYLTLEFEDEFHSRDNRYRAFGVLKFKEILDKKRIPYTQIGSEKAALQFLKEDKKEITGLLRKIKET